MSQCDIIILLYRYSDKVKCIVPSTAQSPTLEDYAAKACWINGIYINITLNIAPNLYYFTQSCTYAVGSVLLHIVSLHLSCRYNIDKKSFNHN